jgi:hypothetical protein
MNAHSPIAEAAEVAATDPLEMLRAPFPPNQISKLPKETKSQADQRKAAQDKGNWPAKCTVCGGLHHEKAVHLDYVGHAAVSDRLLDVDPQWYWEPVAFGPNGLPMFDASGGLWIRLTIRGVTRLGYGHAAAKPNMDAGAREKECIGDALRNAAMRFGVALDLWHKGDLHAHQEADGEPLATAEELATNHLRSCAIDKAVFSECWAKNKANWRDVLNDEAYRRVVAEMQRLAAKLNDAEKAAAPRPEPKPDFGIGEDEIPDFS